MSHRDTPATYSTAEADAILESAARGDDPLNCPRCGEALELGPPDVRDGVQMREAGCPNCQRCIMVPGA